MAFTTPPLAFSAAFFSTKRQFQIGAFFLALAILATLSAAANACTAPQGSFCVDYFNNRTLSGSPVYTTSESSINHTWINASPDPSLPVYNFSGHWQGQFNFAGGTVVFSALSDDGVRIIIDGQTVINEWVTESATLYTANVTLSAGVHWVEVEYFQQWGIAQLKVGWQSVPACDLPVNQFCVAYFNNATLTGNPTSIDHETGINHNWIGSSPAPALPIYNFSGNWQGSFDFAPGTYSFSAIADDGVRVWVDGQLLIDGWTSQAATQYNQWLWLSGNHQVSVNYFQAYGNASLQVYWNLIAPASNTPPTPIGANAFSPLGINLSQWTDWGTEQPFINAFKTSSNWFTQAPGVWDTGEEQHLNLDPNGWVISLPAINDTSVSFRTVSTLLLGGADFVGIRPGGDYVVLYDGEGSLTYGFAATKLASQSRPGRDVVSVDTINPTGILITIASTDPNHSGNYLRNIRVVPPGIVCNDDPLAFCYTASDPACQRSACSSMESAVSSRLFHPLFLRNLVYYRSLRFMAPQNTNVIASTLPQQINWTDRATLDTANWASQAGIPIEAAVSLANLVQADPWLNMPYQASDDYIRQFARLVHTSLDPSRKVYVEYANEIWNTAFSAGLWVEQQGQAAWPSAPDSAYTKRINWYGMRTAQTCDIWQTEWAGDANRIVCVLSAQAANTFTANAALDCALWSQAPCQAHGIHAVAIAPYFGTYLGGISTASEVAGWTAAPDGGLSQLFAELNYGGQLTGGQAGGALAQSAQWVTQYASLAQTRGLQLLAYEGGQGLAGVGSVQNNPNITRLFVSANRDSRMTGVYETMLAEWFKAGGGLFMHYSSMGQYGQYGSWGVLENMQQTTSPKQDALLQFINQTPN